MRYRTNFLAADHVDHSDWSVRARSSVTSTGRVRLHRGQPGSCGLESQRNNIYIRHYHREQQADTLQPSNFFADGLYDLAGEAQQLYGGLLDVTSACS